MAEPEPHPLTVESPDDWDEPPATPAGVADANFAANVRETRERLKMSQGELARRMSDRGFPYYQQTVRRVEDGKRKVSVGEGGALAEILRTTVDRLTWPGREASTAALLDRVTAKTERAFDQIIHWTGTLLFAQRQLGTTVGEAQRAGHYGSDRIRDQARAAEEALEYTPEDAVARGRRQHEELIEEAASELDG